MGVTVRCFRGVVKTEVRSCSYGELSNDIFLLDYGFCPDGDNRHDTVEVAYSVQVLDAAAALSGVDLPGATDRPQDLEPFRREALAAAGLLACLTSRQSAFLGGGQVKSSEKMGAAGAVNEAVGSSPIDTRLVALARVLACESEADLPPRSCWTLSTLGALRPPTHPATSPQVGRLRNQSQEIVALRALAGLCLVTLTAFRTTLEDDDALLAHWKDNQSEAPDGGWTLNTELAVKLRRQKKQVLVDCVKFLGELLKEKPKDAATRPDKLGPDPRDRKKNARGFGKK